MIHWDHEARRRKLDARLKALGAPQLVAFVCATLDEAMKVAGPARHPSRTLLRDSIALARRAKPPTKEELERLATRIGDAQPDEDDSPPSGCADLLDGAAALCKLVGRPVPRTASTAASYAYQAVLERFIDREASCGGEAEFMRAERATPEAMAFLESQYAALAKVEG